MKIITHLCGAILVLPLCASPQLSFPPATSLPVIVESGPHHRIWQRVTVDDRGRAITNSYTELATGLNFFNPLTGRYEASLEQFITTKDGHAIATKGPHNLILAPDINSGGSVDFLTPDGKRLVSNPMGLSFRDASGKNVLLAEVTNSIGELVAPNIIVYPDAFDTIKAALRYTYTKAGCSQDVILYQNPGSPADYGLDPATTVLEMYTEFYNPPTPAVRPGSDGDETLNFGQMEMGRGAAYLLDERLEEIPVIKTWVQIESRQFLIEAVPYDQVKGQLDKLQASLSKEKKKSMALRSAPDRYGLLALDGMRPRQKAREVASTLPDRSAGLQTGRSASKPQTWKIAGIKPGRTSPQQGSTLDYTTINVSQTNYTLTLHKSGRFLTSAPAILMVWTDFSRE